MHALDVALHNGALPLNNCHGLAEGRDGQLARSDLVREMQSSVAVASSRQGTWGWSGQRVRQACLEATVTGGCSRRRTSWPATYYV